MWGTNCRASALMKISVPMWEPGSFSQIRSTLNNSIACLWNSISIQFIKLYRPIRPTLSMPFITRGRLWLGLILRLLLVWFSLSGKISRLLPFRYLWCRDLLSILALKFMLSLGSWLNLELGWLLWIMRLKWRICWIRRKRCRYFQAEGCSEARNCRKDQLCPFWPTLQPSTKISRTTQT